MRNELPAEAQGRYDQAVLRLTQRTPDLERIAVPDRRRGLLNNQFIGSSAPSIVIAG